LAYAPGATCGGSHTRAQAASSLGTASVRRNLRVFARSLAATHGRRVRHRRWRQLHRAGEPRELRSCNLRSLLEVVWSLRSPTGVGCAQAVAENGPVGSDHHLQRSATRAAAGIWQGRHSFQAAADLPDQCRGGSVVLVCAGAQAKFCQVLLTERCARGKSVVARSRASWSTRVPGHTAGAQATCAARCCSPRAVTRTGVTSRAV
jgi:hypothetical protein